MSKQPHLYIIAGPNGAGKTTFARTFLPDFVRCKQFENADLIAGGFSPFEPESAAIKAGRLLLEQIHRLADKKVDFGFETTLSGITYVSLLKKLKASGYYIHLIFLWVPNVELSLRRIADRVRRGGHNIPEATVRRRFYRGIKNLFSKYRFLLDAWDLYDNSGMVSKLIAFEDKRKLTVLGSILFKKIMKGSEII